MIVSAVAVFVGDFQENVRVALRLNPFDGVHHARTHGVFIPQNLILPLIKAAEDHCDAVTVARFDDALNAGEIRGRRVPSGSKAEFTAPS